MNPAPNVIHFHCQTCGILLTVPAEMAGVSGPCPNCGATITSPPASMPLAPSANPFAPPLQQPMGAPAAAASPVHATAQPPQADPPPIVPRSPAGAMTGASWPPTATASDAPGAHPVMERLLHTQPAVPSALPPYQQRSGSSPKKRVSSTRQKGKRGAMVLAIFMAALVLAGISWFFRDQLRATWLSYTLKEDETHADSVPKPTSTLPSAPVPAGNGGGEAARNDPPTPAPTSSKTLPVTQSTPPLPGPVSTPPQPSASTTPPAPPPGFPPALTILPALPANSTKLPTPPTAPVTSASTGAPPSSVATPQPIASSIAPPSSTSPATGGLVEVASSSSGGPPVNVVPPPPPVLPVISGVTPDTQPALDALQNFFHAKTWQQRLPLVQVPASMKPLMEQYYSANPDGPLYVSHIQMIRYDKAPETGPPHCVFQVSGGGLKQPLPIMVEITDQGWKVDWLTFTEFKDELLLKFLEAPQAEPARFHVLMRRAHYFGDDVPALDKKTCVQVMPPMPGFTGDVFAIKGTSVARDLDKYLGWDVSQAAAVVELQWRQDDSYKWVELTNLVQLNWRNVEPPADKEAAAAPPTKKSGGASAPSKATAVP